MPRRFQSSLRWLLWLMAVVAFQAVIAAKRSSIESLHPFDYEGKRKPRMHTAQTVYESSVAALPKSERLKLAAIILDELTASAGAVLDFSDSWSDEDVRDLTDYAARYAGEIYPDGV